MSVTTYDHAPHDGAGASYLSTVEALRRLALRRDSEAWSAVLHNHGVDILKLALRITGDSSLCEDACQETLLQIRAHAGSFTPPGSGREAEAAARGWVMCIAYRTTVGMLRVRQRRSQNEEQAGLAQRAQSPIPAADPILSAEQLAVVRHEIAGLPDLLRSAVCLHFYGEMTYPELSAALECSEKAARKRVERGVQRLRARLATCGLAIGVTALAGTLAGPAQASAAASVLSLSNTLSVSRLAEWQALLHNPAAPLLAGVAKAGGIVIMTKYVAGVAAVLAFALSGVQTFRINSLSRELAEMSEKAAAGQEQKERMDALEQQLAENLADTTALKSSVTARNEELATLSKKPDKNTTPMGFEFFDAPAGAVAANAGNGIVAMENGVLKVWELPVPPPQPVQDPAAGPAPHGATGIVVNGENRVVAMENGVLKTWIERAPTPAPGNNNNETKGFYYPADPNAQKPVEEINPLAQIPLIGDLFVKPPAEAPAPPEVIPSVAQEMLQKIAPDRIGKDVKDVTIKLLENGTLQYQTERGKILAEIKDIRVMQEMGLAPKDPVVPGELPPHKVQRTIRLAAPPAAVPPPIATPPVVAPPPRMVAPEPPPPPLPPTRRAPKGAKPPGIEPGEVF